MEIKPKALKQLNRAAEAASRIIRNLQESNWRENVGHLVADDLYKFAVDIATDIAEVLLNRELNCNESEYLHESLS